MYLREAIKCLLGKFCLIRFLIVWVIFTQHPNFIPFLSVLMVRTRPKDIKDIESVHATRALVSGEVGVMAKLEVEAIHNELL